MKTFMFVLLVTALSVSLFAPEIQAADTLKVKLSLNKVKIETNIQSADVNQGQFIQFYTDGKEIYSVTIVNDNNFFNIDTKLISFTVQKGQPHTYQVGNTDKTMEAKISPFNLIDPPDIEIIPTAPPRIVVSTPIEG